MKDFDEDDWSEEGESGEQGAESGDVQEEEEEAQDMTNVDTALHVKPFSRSPLLGHHSHPYFVISNALPKLQKYDLLLRSEHRDLLTLMNNINAIWMSRLPKAPSSFSLGKRHRPGDEPSDDDADNGPPKHKTRGAARGNSKLSGMIKPRPVQPAAPTSVKEKAKQEKQTDLAKLC
jgi:hypothetical protein